MADINLLRKPNPLPEATPPLARSEMADPSDGPSFTAVSPHATNLLSVYVRGPRFRSTSGGGLDRSVERAFFKTRQGALTTARTNLRLRNA